MSSQTFAPGAPDGSWQGQAGGEGQGLTHMLRPEQSRALWRDRLRAPWAEPER